MLPEAARAKVEAEASPEHVPVSYETLFVPADLDHKKVKLVPNFYSTVELSGDRTLWSEMNQWISSMSLCISLKFSMLRSVW